jgi:hypothetical protein
VPAGSYEWRLLRTPGFSREFLVNVGINTPWSPFDVWPGNHFGPNVLMVDDDACLYVGSVSSEGPPHLLKMALDGSRKFWDTGTWGLRDGLRGMSRIGKILYLQMEAVLELRGFDDGKGMRLSRVDLIHAADDRTQKKISPMCLAGGNNFVVVTYRDHNEVRCLWPHGDRIEREKTLSLPQPGAVAVSPDGRAFVVSAEDVVQVDLESGRSTTVVRDVPQPGRITFDPVFEDILIVSNSKSIRRYHVTDGKLIAVYGRPEGRSYGLFDPLDFDGLLEIAADRRGGFVVAEQYPRRVAHFRGREQHEVVNQWFGGMQWGSQATIDPADPKIVYLPIDNKHLGRGIIDYKTKTWNLTHLYDTIDHGSWGVGKSSHLDILPFAGERNFWEVRHVDGQTFLVNRGGGVAEGSVTVLRVDDKENRLWPVAHLGGLHRLLDGQRPPDLWLGALNRARAKGSASRYPAFSWSDRNQNGLVDVEEILPSATGAFAGSYSCFVGPDWDVVVPLREGDCWRVIPNEGTRELPVWNWDHARRGNARFHGRELKVVRPSTTSIYRDRQGDTYLTVNSAQEDRDLADVPPMNWPNNKNHTSRFLKWDTHGRQAFSVGLHTDSKGEQPGVFADVRAILGEAQDCLVLMDACSPAGVWTRDGLYAGALNDDVGLPTKLDGWEARAYRKKVHDDNQWGQLTETADGDVLWGQLRDNSTPFYRITGWKHWERQNDRITLDTAAVPALRRGTGLTVEYFASAELGGTPVVRANDPEIRFGAMRGDHRMVRAASLRVRSELRKLSPEEPFSARWTGSVEAPLSEEFTFRIYSYGKNESGDRVRLWIDGKLVIDAWDKIKLERFQTDWYYTRELASPPIALLAGKRVPIKIEYVAHGGTDEHLHLYWMSRSFDQRHVPRAYLYPAGNERKTRGRPKS